MRYAFTLIELLVVMAVIGVVTAILIPVLGMVRSQAHQVGCQSNLRQLGIAQISYASDNRGLMAGTISPDFRNNIISYVPIAMIRNGSQPVGQLRGIGPLMMYLGDDEALMGVMTCPANRVYTRARATASWHDTAASVDWMSFAGYAPRIGAATPGGKPLFLGTALAQWTANFRLLQMGTRSLISDTVTGYPGQFGEQIMNRWNISQFNDREVVAHWSGGTPSWNVVCADGRVERVRDAEVKPYPNRTILGHMRDGNQTGVTGGGHQAEIFFMFDQLLVGGDTSVWYP
jgi:prepilin-type N-terminal cleavage/methylation domain-containing protein